MMHRLIALVALVVTSCAAPKPEPATGPEPGEQIAALMAAAQAGGLRPVSMPDFARFGMWWLSSTAPSVFLGNPSAAGSVEFTLQAPDRTVSVLLFNQPSPGMIGVRYQDPVLEVRSLALEESR